MRARPTRAAKSALTWTVALVVAIAAVLGSALMLRTGAASANAPSTALAPVAVSATGVVTPPPVGAYCGVFREPAPFVMSTLDSYDAAVSSKTPAIVMWFQPWAPGTNRSFDETAVGAVIDRGAIPLITWEPWNPGGDPNYLANPANQPAYSHAKIISGTYDDYIRGWATDIKALGGPVMLRPLHEMNGTWYPWGGTVNGNTPSSYIATWRHIHDIFAEENVTNVTWVWSINHASIPNTYENRYGAFWPGSAYVDWVSVSGLNWGTTRPGSKWKSFDTIYTAPLTYLKTLNKPIIIAEFGCVPEGGDKPAWIRDAYTKIRTNHSQVKAVLYYDKREVGLKGTQRWHAGTSWQSLRAYRQMLSDPYWVGAP